MLPNKPKEWNEYNKLDSLNLIRYFPLSHKKSSLIYKTVLRPIRVVIATKYTTN